MLSENIIEPAQKEWASPIVFAPKKGGTLRFYADYQRLNAVTKRDSYPILLINECTDSLAAAAVLSTLDANSGYWKIEIHKADRDKTASTSQGRLYRFI